MKLNAGGAASGAISGASLGSIIPGIGTGVGAIGGALLGAFSGGKKKLKKHSTLDSTQQKLYKNWIDALMNGTGPFGDFYNFDAQGLNDMFTQSFANPAYQNFQENVIPGITGQFRGGNLQNSSYLGGALAKAGTDVQKDLDAQLARMLYQGQQDSLSRRVDALNNIMNMQTFAYEQPQASATDQIFGALNKYGGKAAGKIFDAKLDQYIKSLG